VENGPATLPLAPPPVEAIAPPAAHLTTWFAALQVAAVCGIPTQLLAAVTIALVGHVPVLDDNGISFEFITLVSLIDTALVSLLIKMFLVFSGESSSTVFLGRRPIRGEVLRGVACVPLVFLAVTGMVLGLRYIAPWTHTVKTSPFEGYLKTPLESGIFLVVVVLAGGVREELQRGFILHRFEQRLGGVRVGLAVFTLAFGLFHLDQGVDVASAICLLGLFWGLLYIQRRSVVWAMTNHACFNAAQVLQAALVKSFGA
jgi:membrane protease YdiL (CAAX protease family)